MSPDHQLIDGMPADAFVAALLRHSSDGIVVSERESGRYRVVSESYCALTGYTRDELIGRTSVELGLVATAEARARGLNGHRGAVHELEVRRKDGEVRLFEFSMQLLPGGLMLTVSRDVTERKQVEEALRASEAETRRAKEDAERANQAKSDFLAHMSHELRTPLHAILGFGELLAREGLPPGQREKLAQINTGANHLLTLINEALDVAAIERGELRLSLEPVHVGEVLGEALEMVAPLAAARSLTIEVPPAGEADVCVMADRQRLKQALLNFLSNAVKYNLERGTITVLCASGEPGRLRIAVADTGVGINAERLTRVFEPFDRLGAETTDVHGTGLGLALTKQVIEAMNGEVGAESEIGLGTTLWLELSVVDVAPEEPPPPAPPPAIPSAGARAEERTVLYIEDNPSNVRLVETILADRPEITLLGAAQGSLGLELVREHRPSLVLLDLNLPDMSGEDVLRGIRSDPNTSAIPVVVLTADARTGQAARLRSAGADDFVTKPFSFTQLLEVIDGLSRSG